MIWRIILAISAILILRGMYYSYYWFMVKRYLNIYNEYLDNAGEKNDAKMDKLLSIKGQLKHVFKIAGVDEYKIPYVEPLGLGFVSRGHLSPADNLELLRQDVVGMVLKLFEHAAGNLKSRAVESFNPIFWIETIIYLPTKFFSYLNLNDDSRLVKLIQAIWWLVGALATITTFFTKETPWEFFKRIF